MHGTIMLQLFAAPLFVGFANEIMALQIGRVLTGLGRDMWVMGLVLASLGTIVGGVNFVTTILRMRAPGIQRRGDLVAARVRVAPGSTSPSDG